MKCQKCTKPAIVHLTEVTRKSGMGDGKKALETHLCLQHAIEAGLLAPPAEATQAIMIKPESPKTENIVTPESATEPSKAIVQAPSGGANLPVPRDRAGNANSALTCSVCGLSWTQFKQAGLMGCPHDYDQFGEKLVPLLKRAQEGATEHVGKVPAKRQTAAGERQARTLRLRRDLQRAVDSENYEQAAQLRDELRQLEQH